MKLKNLKKEILFMKRLKLAALTTALVLSVTAFAACGKKDKDNAVVGNNWSALKLTDVYNTTYVEKDDYTPITATKIDEFTGYKKFTISNSGYTLPNYDVLQVLYKETEVTKDNVVTKVTTYKLYNLMLNKVVKTFTVDDAVYYTSGSVGTYVNFVFKYQYINGARYAYAVQAQTKDLSTGTGTTDTYSLDGKLLSSSATVDFVNFTYIKETDEDNNDAYLLRFTVIDDDDATVRASYIENVYTGETKTADKKPVNEIKDFKEDITEVAGLKIGYDKRGYVYIYDKDTEELKFTFDLTGPAENSNIALIGNGNILYQTHSLLPADADNYDFVDFSGGETSKYALKSYVLNTSDGSKTEVTLDFTVNEIRNKNTDEDDFTRVYKDGIENVASIYRIIDKKHSGNRQLAVVKNDLTVVGVIEDVVPYQNSEAELVGDNLFKVRTSESGDVYYFVNGDGKIVGKRADGVSYAGDAYMYTESALYSARTLDKILDFVTDDYTASFNQNNFGGNVLLRKLYKDNEKGADFLLYKKDSKTPVVLFNSKDVAGFSTRSDYCYYYKRNVDKYGVTVSFHNVYINTEGKTIFEFDTDGNSSGLFDGNVTLNGVDTAYRFVNVKKADGTYETVYYRAVI